jgi:hypothetical protein
MNTGTVRSGRAASSRQLTGVSDPGDLALTLAWYPMASVHSPYRYRRALDYDTKTPPVCEPRVYIFQVRIGHSETETIILQRIQPLIYS